MHTGITRSGFEFKINDASLNDFELVEMLADLDTNPLLLPKVVSKLLGADQKKRLYDHVRTEDGIVPANVITDEIMDIFSSKNAKN